MAYPTFSKIIPIKASKLRKKQRRLQHGEALIKSLRISSLSQDLPDLAIYAKATLQDQQKAIPKLYS